MAKFRQGNLSTAKLTEAQVLEILQRRAANESYPSLARYFQVSTNTIARICNGETWQHVSRAVGDEALAEFTGPEPSEAELQASLEKLNAIPDQPVRREDPYAVFLDKGRRGVLEIDLAKDMKPRSTSTCTADSVTSDSSSSRTVEPAGLARDAGANTAGAGSSDSSTGTTGDSAARSAEPSKPSLVKPINNEE